ncbi:MAG: hypothetical protein ABIF40_02855 [archaeon]
MHGCKGHKWAFGLLILALGVLFLLVDLGIWTFWGINWWTAIFLLMGLTAVSHGCCKECKDMCKPKKK